MKYLPLPMLAALIVSCGGDPDVSTPDPQPTGEVADEIRIVYQGRLDGEYEPCG